MWSEVKWSEVIEVKWSEVIEVNWSEVKWSEWRREEERINDQFLLKMEPKEPSPTHPNRTEHKQEPPTRSRGRPRLPTEQKEQPPISYIKHSATF